MRCERLVLSGDALDTVARLRALIPAPGSVTETVAEILAEVRSHGDEALSAYTRRFDTAGASPAPLLVSDAELEDAQRRLDPAVRSGLEQAIENIRAVARRSAERGGDSSVAFGDHEVVLRRESVQRAAIYVPGGRAPYPSTVVMGAVPARVAGVPEVVVCAPPGVDGDVDPVILGACRLVGASAVYRMGGAQAIAALAYGTESVTAVDVIVGPGNLYVQEAKRQVSGQVGIDGFAGPSDLLVIADPDVDPEPLLLDLLAQAEHGLGTLVVAISESAELLEQLAGQLAQAPDSRAVAACVQVPGAEQALALVQAFAPEHLQLMGAGAEALSARVTRAGCVFVGAEAGTAFGDYIAGSSHVLPTNGAGRFASALSPDHFQRGFAEVRIRDGSELARAAAPIARAEGFEFHARSMEARIRDNEGR